MSAVSRVILWGGAGIVAMFVASGVIGPRMVCAGFRPMARFVCREHYAAVKDWILETSRPAPPDLKVAVGSVPEDPWGCDYRIAHIDGGGFRICSNGPDCVPRTDDDVCYPQASGD